MDYKDYSRMYTFNAWSAAGYKIIKGSKAHWVDGVPMFSLDQVAKTQPRSYGNHWIGCTPKGSFDYYDEYEDAGPTYDPWMGGYF